MLMFGDDLSIYKEIPVDIDTFISDPKYLGKSTNNGELIYPFWREKLHEILQSDREMVFISTAIGTGKTIISTICSAYQLYCLMCLKNPIEHFCLMDGDNVSIMIATSYYNNDTAYNTFMHYVENSPWFWNHGEIEYDEFGHAERYVPDANVVINRVVKHDHLLGSQLFGGYIAPKGEDRESEMIDILFSARARVQSRFTRDGVCYGKLFVDNDFEIDDELITRMTDMNYMVIRGSQWEIKPKDWFSDETITVVVNPIVGKSRVIWDTNIVPKLEEGEYIVEFPEDFKFNLEHDLESSLLLIANLDRTLYEHDVKFMDAMEGMLYMDKAIKIPGDRHSYFVEHDTIYDERHVRIDLSPVEFFKEFICCNNWEVFPKEYIYK